MPDIKTRAVAEKTVKTIDKSAIAAQRMKNAYVQAKEKAKRSAPVDQESPESYASDWVSNGVSTAAFEGVHQFDRQGRKRLDATKVNLAKVKERFQRKRLIDPLKKRARKETAEPVCSPVDAEGSTRRGRFTSRLGGADLNTPSYIFVSNIVASARPSMCRCHDKQSFVGEFPFKIQMDIL